MRHGGRAFLPFGKKFFRFQYFGFLEMPDFDGKLFQRTAAQRQRIHKLCMTVPLQDLSGNRRRLKAKFFADISFDKRIEMLKCPYSARYFSCCNCFLCRFQTFDIAFNLCEPERKFQTECDRLGVYAVRTPDHNRIFKLLCTAAEHVFQLSQSFQQEIRGLVHLHGKRGVEHIGRRHAEMYKTGLRPYIFSHAG